MIVRTKVLRSFLPGIAAGLLALVLLFFFQQVVQAGVAKGAQRRSASAQLHDATWRCKALRGKQAQLDCLVLIPQQAPGRRSAVLDRSQVTPGE